MLGEKKYLLPLVFLFTVLQAYAQPVKITSPLTSFSATWDNDIYSKANTARDVAYLTAEEKDLIWILNLVRMNPKLFLNTVLLNPKSEFYVKPEFRSSYQKSLIAELQKQKPAPSFIRPNAELFAKAKCHAINAGKNGYVGHERKWPDCTGGYFAECCSYGYEDPLDIVMQLLIDDGVPSLGHRKICLSYVYDQIGVSIQPHIAYGTNAVLDLN